MELVYRDQPVIEGLDAEPIHGEAEGGMGADQHLVIASQKCAERINLAAIVGAWRIAQIPLRLDAPVSPETELAQRFIVKARSDRLLGHHDNSLLDPLVRQLVERDEHQRTALAGSGRRFDQQILLTPPFKGTFLHRAHAQRIGLGGSFLVGV